MIKLVIKPFRKKTGMSQTAVGAECKRSHATISRWENNKTSPRTANLDDLGTLFGCDPRLLIEGVSVLGADEAAYLSAFRSITPDQQAAIQQMLNVFGGAIADQDEPAEATERLAPIPEKHDGSWLQDPETVVWVWASNAKHVYTHSDPPTHDHHRQANYILGKTRWGFANGDPVNDVFWRRHKADLDAHRDIVSFVYEYATPDGRTVRCRADGEARFTKGGKFRGYKGTTISLVISAAPLESTG